MRTHAYRHPSGTRHWKALVEAGQKEYRHVSACAPEPPSAMPTRLSKSCSCLAGEVVDGEAVVDELQPHELLVLHQPLVNDLAELSIDDLVELSVNDLAELSGQWAGLKWQSSVSGRGAEWRSS